MGVHCRWSCTCHREINQVLWHVRCKIVLPIFIITILTVHQSIVNVASWSYPPFDLVHHSPEEIIIVRPMVHSCWLQTALHLPDSELWMLRMRKMHLPAKILPESCSIIRSCTDTVTCINGINEYCILRSVVTMILPGWNLSRHSCALISCIHKVLRHLVYPDGQVFSNVDWSIGLSVFLTLHFL
jgi:hypothetical protein